MEVEVLKSLDNDVRIWRYMSLDKFINLVSGSLLYFTPLWKYVGSDPYEGVPPAVALKALFGVGKKYHDELLSAISSFESQYPDAPDAAKRNIERVKAEMAERPERFYKTSQPLFKGQLVSCWHANRSESEAMWKLYSDSGKGIAISSTVGSLANSLRCGPDHKSISKIFLGRVRYIDYSDPDLTPSDCVVDGHLSPLLKRLSFKHEEEVRAFFLPACDIKQVESFKPESMSLPVSIRDLVQGIYISPYADKSFSSAVKVIVEQFDLADKLVNSSILESTDHLYEEILSRLDQLTQR